MIAWDTYLKPVRKSNFKFGKTMNKKQLIDALSTKLKRKNIHYPKWELESLVDPALEVIMETLSRNEEIQLNKFGRFSIKHKKGSAYYNINTGQKEIAPDKKIIQFTPHKGFRFDDTPDVPCTGSNIENNQE